ncbi:MAG TPA: hypothetical protein VMW25_02810 [Clostridia bacterium]|nr:hypothetical protein [Clostridia bacterium]
MSAEHGPKVERIIKNEDGVPGVEGPAPQVPQEETTDILVF